MGVTTRSIDRGRHIDNIQTIDKAEELEKRVAELSQQVNSNIKGARIESDLTISEHFNVGGKDFYNGFIGIGIKYFRAEPDFLTIEGRNQWWDKMRQVAKKRFGMTENFSVDIGCIRDLDYISISFNENSKSEHYALTPRKISILETGFNKVREFIEWYNSSVQGYDDLRKTHIDRFKSFLDGL